MSQGASVESSTQPFSTPSINPVLQSALSSLDVHLEEELYRYRRQKSGRPVPSARGLGRHQNRKPIELISVGNAAGSTQSPASRMPSAPPTSYPQSTLINSALSSSDLMANQELTSQTDLLDASPSTNTGEPVSFQLTVSKKAAPEADNPGSANSESQPGYPQTEASVGANLANSYANPSQPDDYLASSEQLLRSLAEEEAEGRSERRFLDSILTPLGVGSMLLFLLSSATVGYIIMNPSTWNSLGLDKFNKPQSPTVAQNNPSPGIPVNSNQPGAQALNGANQASPIVSGPNLATQEFVELNLNTLSSLKNNVSPSPALVPGQRALPPVAMTNLGRGQTSAAIGGRPSDLASAILPPSVSSAVIPPRVPAVAPIPVPPVPVNPGTEMTPTARQKQTQAATRTSSGSRNGVAANSSQAGKDSYYVLTNYQNDRSLEKTRQVVADAYVRNFPDGARIQVATFNKESQAKKLVQELKKQGIYAWVYHQP